MNDSKGKRIFELAARWLVGGVLVYAGFSKALGPAAEFAANIEAYKLLPGTLITPFSIALPWLEIWVGLFLVAGFHTRVSAVLSTLLFVMFIGALGSAIVRHLDLNTCGCFGQEALTPKQTIGGDILLLGLSIVLTRLRLACPYLSLDTWLDRP